MAPADDGLVWAQDIINAHPGLPTIVTTHDHLDTHGQRKAIREVDFKAVDARHNDPEDVWRKFVRVNDQIFLVLSGHQYGQSHRADTNVAGHPVYQVMADYQERHQSFVTATPSRANEHVGIGDGWLRLMQFDMSGSAPEVRVWTYSTHYKAHAEDLPTYAAFYKADEKPELGDKVFLAEDDFTLNLEGFAKRFAGVRAN